MKRFYYTVAIIILIILSCNKPTEFPTEQSVVFKASPNSSILKSTCDQPIANFALIEIDEITYQVEVFYLDGKIYTNTLKLSSGAHTLNMFVLGNYGDNFGDPADDIIVLAAPKAGSEFANFVNRPLPFTFEVNAFFKSEVYIELLCFEPANYEYFGFSWYSIEEIIVREFCFIGDMCVDNIEAFTNTLYENQSNGLVSTMPCIFKVDVYRNDVFVISYNNEESYGEGGPLCVKYPDYASVVDNFSFVLSVLGPDGYVEYLTYTSTDDEPAPTLNQNLVIPDENDLIYFAFGDCIPDTFTGCETAFAYDAYKAYCFQEISYISSENWGWSNGSYDQSANSYTMDIYAGAGQCDINKGYLVGYLVLTYNNLGHVKVTYNLNPGYKFTELHLYVGYTKYQDGNPTVAPGQYPYKIDDLNTDTYTFDLKEDNFSGPIYIIAHSVVCKI